MNVISAQRDALDIANREVSLAYTALMEAIARRDAIQNRIELPDATVIPNGDEDAKSFGDWADQDEGNH